MINWDIGKATIEIKIHLCLDWIVNSEFVKSSRFDLHWRAAMHPDSHGRMWLMEIRSFHWFHRCPICWLADWCDINTHTHTIAPESFVDWVDASSFHWTSDWLLHRVFISSNCLQFILKFRLIIVIRIR